MQNEVIEEPNGILTVVDHGVQTRTVLEETERGIREIAVRQRASGRPVRILVDVRDMQGQTAESRKYVVEMFERLDFDKTAAFGTSVFLKHLINFLISMSGKKERIRYFDNEAQARAWLTG